MAVDAIIEGVPAFCSEHSAAAPVANKLSDLSSTIENPTFWGDNSRLAWACSLAWGQFTVDEISSGLARRVLEGQLP